MNGSLVRICLFAAAALASCAYPYPGDVQPDGGGPLTCSNGRIDEGEDCDGPLLGGATCFSEGRIEGELGCTSSCTYDYSACHDCGNGTREGAEACDSTNLGGATCATRGFDGGALGCAPNCLSFDESACTDCGDGMREGAEECDGADLGTASCTSLGFAGGTLSCNACMFNTSGCNNTVPTVPKLRLPMNDSYEGASSVGGSLRPRFTWEASTWSGSGTVMYDLQYSADATFAIGTVSVPSSAATSHRPASDLPVQMVAPVGTRYYWRVRACVGAACSAYSTAWRVNLGRNPRDVNGDGYADIVVGASGNDAGGQDAGRVYLYFGAPGSTLDPAPDATLTGQSATDSFGTAVAILGDVNGDGFGDLGVGASGNDAGGDGAGRAYVFLGGPGTTLDTTADGIMTGAAVMDSFGVSISGAGDVNGDGFADVIVGAHQTSTASGRAYLFLGGAGATFDTTIDATLMGQTNGDSFGYGVSGAGDTNGDGYHDVIVGAYAYGSSAGRAYIFLGGAGAFNTSFDSTLTGATANDFFGHSVAGAGDVNGDGFADVAVGAYGNDAGGSFVGAAYVFRGSSSDTLDPTPDGTLVGPADAQLFGACVASAGDLNGDGFSDVVVGAPNTAVGGMFGAGRAHVFFGSAGASFDTTSDGTLNGLGVADDYYGTSVASAGDVNGDGFAEVVVGSPGADTAASNAGRIFVYFGGAGTSLNTVYDGSPSGAAMNDGFGRDVH